MRGIVVAVLFVAGVARGDGRPPVTNSIRMRPGDPHSLYVGTTFGLLISHDDGCTFDWVCEANVGYGGVFDPKYAIAADGTIFATTFTGLRISHDGGCSFQTATQALPPGDPDRIAGVWIDAIDIGPTGEVWLGTAEGGGTNDVFASSDNGATFHARGRRSATVWWKSVKVAPSNPRRVYITGYQVAGKPAAHLLRSDDDGAHWTEAPLAGVRSGATPIVMVDAIDPANPDRIYVRSIAAHAPAGDRLYRSDDGGTTLTEVLATSEPITGVVIRAGGGVVVATQRGGAFASSDGRAFAPIDKAPRLACLAEGAGGVLYSCAANWQPDNMAVGKSTDGGATWSSVWRFVDLHGPLACPDGAAERDVCELQQWPTLAAQFGAQGPACGAERGAVPTNRPAPPAARRARGGCCDGGAGSGELALALALLTAWHATTGRRARRRARASSGRSR